MSDQEESLVERAIENSLDEMFHGGPSPGLAGAVLAAAVARTPEQQQRTPASKPFIRWGLGFAAAASVAAIVAITLVLPGYRKPRELPVGVVATPEASFWMEEHGALRAQSGWYVLTEGSPSLVHGPDSVRVGKGRTIVRVGELPDAQALQAMELWLKETGLSRTEENAMKMNQWVKAGALAVCVLAGVAWVNDIEVVAQEVAANESAEGAEVKKALLALRDKVVAHRDSSRSKPVRLKGRADCNLPDAELKLSNHLVHDCIFSDGRDQGVLLASPTDGKEYHILLFKWTGKDASCFSYSTFEALVRANSGIYWEAAGSPQDVVRRTFNARHQVGARWKRKLQTYSGQAVSKVWTWREETIELTAKGAVVRMFSDAGDPNQNQSRFVDFTSSPDSHNFLLPKADSVLRSGHDTVDGASCIWFEFERPGGGGNMASVIPPLADYPSKGQGHTDLWRIWVDTEFGLIRKETCNGVLRFWIEEFDPVAENVRQWDRLYRVGASWTVKYYVGGRNGITDTTGTLYHEKHEVVSVLDGVANVRVSKEEVGSGVGLQIDVVEVSRPAPAVSWLNQEGINSRRGVERLQEWDCVWETQTTAKTWFLTQFGLRFKTVNHKDETIYWLDDFKPIR